MWLTSTSSLGVRCDRGALAEENFALLTDACERAGIVLGAFDSRILGWPANYEPEHAPQSLE
jgi:hypothetical protein